MRKNFFYSLMGIVLLLGFTACSPAEDIQVKLPNEKAFDLLKYDPEKFAETYKEMDSLQRTQLLEQVAADTNKLIEALAENEEIQVRSGNSWKNFSTADLSWSQKGLFTGPFSAPNECSMRVFAMNSEDSPLLSIAATISGYRDARINVTLLQATVIGLTNWCGQLPSGSSYGDVAYATEYCDGLGNNDAQWVKRYIPRG